MRPQTTIATCHGHRSKEAPWPTHAWQCGVQGPNDTPSKTQSTEMGESQHPPAASTPLNQAASAVAAMMNQLPAALDGTVSLALSLHQWSSIVLARLLHDLRCSCHLLIAFHLTLGKEEPGFWLDLSLLTTL